MKKNLLAAAVSASTVWLAATHPQPVHAAFFQLAENSPAELGHAFSGGAAIAEDASTVWYNPAGLTRLSGGPQLVAGGYYIMPSIKASRVTARAVTSVPISGGNGGDAGESALVPNVYLSYPVSERLVFGLGVNVPYGLATDYEDGWAGRYHADRSEIKTININPAVGFRIDDRLSLGAGLNWQRLDAELSQFVDFATICTISGPITSALCGAAAGFNPNTNPNDGHAKITADDTAWGYNVGLLWQFAPSTRFGLHYRSKLDYHLAGSVSLSAPANVPATIRAAAGEGSGARADVTLPAALSLSVYSQLDPRWAVMADFTRTYWSDLPALKIDFTNTPTANDSVVTLNLKNADRYAVGASYAPPGASHWVFRAGVALDKTPVPSAADRTPRLPDEDRLWLAFGAGYRTAGDLRFDLAYAYIKVDNAHVEKTASGENLTRGSLDADYKSKTHILSAQLNWPFK
jgi:long-chain fatty acid transport protein